MGAIVVAHIVWCFVTALKIRYYLLFHYFAELTEHCQMYYTVKLSEYYSIYRVF